jgi:hypothetical protein
MIDTVAVVSGGSPDYLIDIVADGMVRLLGRKNVYAQYFWLRPEAAENRIFRHLYSLTTGQPNTMSLSECQALVASVRVPLEYIKKYKKSKGGIVAVVDGEDTRELKSDYLKIADAYFKREYFRNERYPVKVFNLHRGGWLIPSYYKKYPDKVFSLSFGIVPFNYNLGDANPEKSGDVFFAGYITSKIRAQLKEMTMRAGYTYLSNILSMDEYVREVRRHWICIAPRGSGWDTYRYWEIPYLGSVLLCQNHPLKIDNDFVHGESCLRFSNVDEAKSLIERFLQNKDKLSYIAKKGRELVMKKHLSIHRTMKVYETLNSLKT